MRTIHKYQLKPLQYNTIDLPVGSDIIDVHEQRGECCIWAQVNTNNDMEKRVFFVAGTGQPFPDPPGTQIMMQHVGTAHCGGFVWHVYEVEGLEV